MNKSGKKIAVLGSVNNDLIISTPVMPRLGETVSGSGFTTASGGKGANQAVAAARLGAEVTLIGAVGRDAFGERMTEGFRRDGIDTRFVRVCDGIATGTAVIVIYEGDNFIILDAGANARVDGAHVTEAAEALAGASAVIVQLEIPLEAVTLGMRLAREAGAAVLFNPAPARALPDGVLKLCDVLIVNETECEILSGRRVASVSDAMEALEVFRALGIPQAVITLGAEGTVYNRGETALHCPARKANAVDTTAAGDSFIGALAVALTEGRDIDECVAFATAAASVTVSRLGAQPSLPYRNEVEQTIGIGEVYH